MKIEKRTFLISVIEAVIVSLAFVLVNVYENYDGYSRNYFYSCKENASFEFDIVETAGTVYPAGTVFEVLYFNADGRLALYIYDDSIQVDSDSSAIALEYGIDPYIRRVNPIVDLKIEDAHNSDELAKVFESLKNNVKKETLTRESNNYQEMLNFACKAGAYTTTGYGAIKAMGDQASIERMVK